MDSFRSMKWGIAIGAGVVAILVVVYLVRAPAHRDPESISRPATQAASALPAGRGTLRDPIRAEADVSVADRKRLELLDEILLAKNDNDPRLDSELRNLSAGAKRLMRERYEQLPAENRNERGTIVFLLGRNLTSEDDFRFFEEVLKEPACLSLADCRAGGPNAASEELHDEMGSEMTLAYPQAVAIKMSETYLRSADATPSLRASAMRTLETARASSVAIVARDAEAALRRLRGE